MRRLPLLAAAVIVLVFAAVAFATWYGKSIISDGTWKTIVQNDQVSKAGGLAFKWTSGPQGSYRASIQSNGGTIYCQSGTFSDWNVVHKISCIHPEPPPGAPEDKAMIVATADGATRGFYVWPCTTSNCSDVP